MIKNRDIIVIGIQPWDIKIGSNCKNIAQEFAKNNRVLYVNQPLDRSTKKNEADTDKVKYRLDVINGKLPDIVEISNDLWNFTPRVMVESINFLPDNFIYNVLNKKNNKKFALEIKRAINILDFKDYIIFNDSLMFLGFYLKEMLNPSAYLYYIRDNLITQPYFGKHGKRLEPLLAKKADAVVSNSTYLANYLKEYNNISEMVGQGCDVSLFNPNGENVYIPDDIKDIKKPIIGYVGFLTSIRLDIDLLEYMARQRKEWSIVLVGPEDDDFKNSELHNIDNVYFLGSKNGKELPAYISTFDVAINPQVVNELTIGNYPRKIDEYLAMGKPTLATNTVAMEYFKDVTYLAETKQDYVALVEKALAENSDELISKRIKCGNSHTWENNVKNIYEIISRVLKKRND